MSCCLLMVATFVLTLAETPAQGAEQEELDGIWIEKVVGPSREEHPGKVVARDPLTLVIDGHLFLLKQGDRAVRQSLLKYVSGQTPKAIDLTTVVGDEFWQSRAIYKLEGDTLTICEAVRDKPRPTEFLRWEGIGMDTTFRLGMWVSGVVCDPAFRHVSSTLSTICSAPCTPR